MLEGRLIDEAARLFFEKGYGPTTMGAVATAARVSKSTLYGCFARKADLFRAMVEREMDLWGNGERNTAIASETTLRDLLLTYGGLALRAGTSDHFIQVNRLLYSESGRFPELAVIASERLEIGVNYLATEIGRRVKCDGVPVRDAFRLARLYLTLLSGWLSNAILNNNLPTDADREEWLSDAVDLFM